MKKNYISLSKRIFKCFFLSFPCFEWKLREKARNILTFHNTSFFFSQNCINYPVSSVSWRINILSKNDHLYFSSQKRNIWNFMKKVSFHRKSLLIDDFLLISLFSSNNKEKTLNIATIYFFSEKHKWRVFQRF